MDPPIPDWVPPDAGEVERRGRLLFAGLARVGLDAWTPGESDLTALGSAKLTKLAATAKIPVVSANLVDAKGKPLFPSELLVQRAGVKIGIFGVTTVE